MRVAERSASFPERWRGPGRARWWMPWLVLRLMVGGLAWLLAASPVSAREEAPATRLPIGMNLAGVSDYTPGFPFRNLMWGARPWMTRQADGGGPFDSGLASALALDDDGYPLQLPAALPGVAAPQVVHTILPNRQAAGRWVLRYDGEGTVVPAFKTRLVSTAPGRLVIAFDGGGDDAHLQGIAITRSVAGNHVRNIRIVSEADEGADLAANPFREDFLAYCRQWHALRFMDWLGTNDSLERDWSDRRRTSFYTMVGRGGDAIGRWGAPPDAFARRFAGGVALELVIQLANLTGTDPWITVPHRATPAYMTAMAQLFKAQLHPARKVYVEYSNELWNFGFKQAGWMLNSKVAADAVIAAGGQAWKHGIEPPLPLDDGSVATSGGEAHPERIAALVRRCFAQWEAVFDGASRGRLVRVVAVQQSYAATQRRTVRWVMAHGGADLMAAAAYFGPDHAIHSRWKAAGAALDADTVIDDMTQVLEQQSMPSTRQAITIAREFGLGYAVYEGGQHIVPPSRAEAPSMPALGAAQFHASMHTLTLRNLRLHAELGCRLFMAFSSVGIQGAPSGSWGHQERYGQPAAESPKLRALLDANLPR